MIQPLILTRNGEAVSLAIFGSMMGSGHAGLDQVDDSFVSPQVLKQLTSQSIKKMIQFHFATAISVSPESQ